MPGTKSAADILKSIEFLQADDEAKKYLHHEFQDYAYRLAEKLGDLAHRPIYMKLAKNVDRILLEQAAAFASDYRDVPNKGKLFMWKLQQLREAAKLRLLKTNFDFDTVMRHMGETEDQLSETLTRRWQKQFEDHLQVIVGEFAVKLAALRSSRRAQVIWELGSSIGLEAKLLTELNFKVKGTGLSAKLLARAKAVALQAKLVRKPTIVVKSPKPVDAIWISRLWSYVPREVESDFLQQLYAVVVPGGLLALGYQLGSEQGQTWEELQLGEKLLLGFRKLSTPDGLATTLEQNAWEIIEHYPAAQVFVCRRT